jgi:peptidyl-prolyl cis-trans isomerase D
LAGLVTLRVLKFMFRFFRKHSWILIVTLSLTIISFVFFMGSGPSRMRGGGGGGSDDLGSINGKKVTEPDFHAANNEVKLYFLFHYGQWPEKVPNVSSEAVEQETYVRLLMIQKADELGIYIGDDSVEAFASEMLRSAELARALGIRGQSVPMGVFVEHILEPEGLTAADFERFARHALVFQQLAQAMGLAGELITPQEATAIYRREHQELSAQAVFFSASNYLSQISVTPAAVGQFYTNYLATYRLPDRVQVSYVAFETSNYFAAAEQKIGSTNLDIQVEGIFHQGGLDAVPDAKTPEKAKAKIREALIRNQALDAARVEANEFAAAVFNLNPTRPENLATVAKQKGLTVHETAPFDSQFGPEEFVAPAEFTKTAFQLTLDEPRAGPVAGPDAFYVIALEKQLPSEIPPLEKIRDRVMQDFRHEQALLVAQQIGTNFADGLAASLAAGKSFASVCVAAGLKPEVLPPFSLSTQELPELDGRADLNQLKQTAFTTPVGHASGFSQTPDGGLIVFVQSQLPLDSSQMNAELPQYAAQIRRARQNEFFGEWLNTEANRSLQDTRIFRRMAGAGALEK